MYFIRNILVKWSSNLAELLAVVTTWTFNNKTLPCSYFKTFQHSRLRERLMGPGKRVGGVTRNTKNCVSHGDWNKKMGTIFPVRVQSFPSRFLARERSAAGDRRLALWLQRTRLVAETRTQMRVTFSENNLIEDTLLWQECGIYFIKLHLHGCYAQHIITYLGIWKLS